MRLAGTPRLADRLRALLHLDDPPGKIALALAVGVFISCTPFLGLQTILAILVATLFPLNRAATIAKRPGGGEKSPSNVGMGSYREAGTIGVVRATPVSPPRPAGRAARGPRRKGG